MRFTAVGEIFDRTLRGLPVDAIVAEATKIELDKDDPFKAIVHMELTFKEEFVNTLTSTIETLATKECDLTKTIRGDPKYARPDWRHESGYPNDINNSGGYYCGSEYQRAAVACIAGQKLRCFALETGYYCRGCEDRDVNHYQPVLYVAYLDEAGQSASTEFCNQIPIDIGIQFGLNFWERDYETNLPGLWFALDNESRNLWFPVDLHQIDIRRARRIVAVVGFYKVNQLRREFVLTSVAIDPAYPVNGGCDFLRETIQRGF